jgi:hypothetical protein
MFENTRSELGLVFFPHQKNSYSNYNHSSRLQTKVFALPQHKRVAVLPPPGGGGWGVPSTVVWGTPSYLQQRGDREDWGELHGALLVEEAQTVQSKRCQVH